MLHNNPPPTTPISSDNETVVWVMPEIFDEMKERVLSTELELVAVKLQNQRVTTRLEHMTLRLNLLLAMGIAGIGAGMVAQSGMEDFNATLGYMISVTAGIFTFEKLTDDSNTGTERPAYFRARNHGEELILIAQDLESRPLQHQRSGHLPRGGQ